MKKTKTKKTQAAGLMSSLFCFFLWLFLASTAPRTQLLCLSGFAPRTKGGLGLKARRTLFHPSQLARNGTFPSLHLLSPPLLCVFIHL